MSVKLFIPWRIMLYMVQKVPANFVPAAAVRREGQALSGMTGRRAHVGGTIVLTFSILLLEVQNVIDCVLECGRNMWNATWRATMSRDVEEHQRRRRHIIPRLTLKCEGIRIETD